MWVDSHSMLLVPWSISRIRWQLNPLHKQYWSQQGKHYAGGGKHNKKQYDPRWLVKLGDSPASSLMMPATPYILDTLQSLPAAASSAQEQKQR